MEYKLIMAVSRYPSLYDPGCPTYRDLNMRSDSWRQVSELVGVPEAECRRKWKMLRDQHRRERQREKDRRESGVGLLNYRPWRYSAILSFLNPFIDARAAGTNGWALDPQPSYFPHEMVGCSTTTETRSDDDDNYGIAVADATTTTSSSSSSEFVQRKRPSSASRDPVRLKEAKIEATSDAAATEDGAQMQQAQQANIRELFETIMQSVTSLASSLASSQASDQLTPLSPPALQTPHSLPPPPPPSRLKTEEQELMEAELLEEEEEFHAVSPRPARVWKRSTDGLLEEYLRRTEAREAQRERDGEKRDDVSMFLLSLAPAMRRLTAEKQSLLRTRIQQLVHEAEFGATNVQ